MGIGVIGAAGSSGSSILGAGEPIFSNSFSIFGKYNTSLAAGSYVVSATAGSKGGDKVEVSKRTSLGNTTIQSGAAIIDTNNQEEASLVFTSHPAFDSPFDNIEYDLNVANVEDSEYLTSEVSKEALIADDGNGKAVLGLSWNGYRTSSNNYHSFIGLCSINEAGASPNMVQSNYSSQSGSINWEWEFLNYSDDEFMAFRRVNNSSLVSSNPNQLYVSQDGISWQSKALPYPFGSNTGSSHNNGGYSRFGAKLNGQYYFKASTSDGAIASTKVYKVPEAQATDINAYVDVDAQIPELANYLAGSPGAYSTDGNGNWIMVRVGNSSSSSSSVKHIAHSTDNGATWSLSTVPNGYSYFTNPVYDSNQDMWFVAVWDGSSTSILYTPNTNLNGWTHYNIANGNSSSPPGVLVKNNSGWHISGNGGNIRYTTYTTSSDPRTTSWSSYTQGSNYGSYNQYLPGLGMWFAMDGTNVFYSTSSLPTSLSSYAFSSMSGTNYADGGGLSPMYRVASSVGAPGSSTQISIISARGYWTQSNSYNNWYARANSGSPTSSSNWTRYLAPIGSGSSSVPLTFYLPILNKFVMINSSTNELAYSSDGLTWTVSTSEFLFGASYPYGDIGYALTDSTYSYVPYFSGSSWSLGFKADESYENLTQSDFPYSQPQFNNAKSWSDGTTNYLSLIASNYKVYTTSDNSTWIEASLPATSSRAMKVIDNKLYLNISVNGTWYWYVTTDGTSFSEYSALPGSYWSIEKINNKYVALDGGGYSNIAVSEDMITWEEVSRPATSFADKALLATSEPNSSWTGTDGQRIITIAKDSVGNNGQMLPAYFDSSDKYGVVYYESTFEDV